MPRFFFNTADGSSERDMIGTELPDHTVARVEAIKFAGRVMSIKPDVLWDGRDFRVEVADASGLVLCTILVLAVDAASTARV